MILKETGRYLLNLILKNKSAFLGNEQRDNCYKPCLFLINVVSTFFIFTNLLIFWSLLSFFTLWAIYDQSLENLYVYIKKATLE